MIHDPASTDATAQLTNLLETLQISSASTTTSSPGIDSITNLHIRDQNSDADVDMDGVGQPNNLQQQVAVTTDVGHRLSNISLSAPTDGAASVTCQWCGAVIAATRHDVHVQLWCPALLHDDDG